MLIEWATTTTSLQLKPFFLLDEIHKLLYSSTVTAVAERKDAHLVRALPRPPREKVVRGGLFSLAIVLLLVLPLLLFSSASPVLQTNPVRATDLAVAVVNANTTLPLFAFNDMFASERVSRQTFNRWNREFTCERSARRPAMSPCDRLSHVPPFPPRRRRRRGERIDAERCLGGLLADRAAAAGRAGGLARRRPRARRAHPGTSRP